MSIQLRSVSIYSHEGERRDVEFRLGALNIVTGASKTGKSALLDIVDYCWGRGECTVAEGEIRKSVSWFMLHLDNNGEGIILARRNPGPAGRASDDIYLARGVEILPPDDKGFTKNITADGLKTQLSSILGISENVHMPEAGSTRLPLEASSRHAIMFSLQGQDEIANRRLLFHRQGEQFMPAAIRDALPYFLGAIDENHFLTLKRFNEAKSRLRKLEREYADASAVTREISTSAQTLLQEARRVNLVPANANAPDVDSVMELLRQASAPRPMDLTSTDDPTADLGELEDRRRRLRGELQEIREEIADVERLNRDASEFEVEAKEQEARLASIGLIKHGGTAADTCPLCENHLAVPVPSVLEIRQSLTGIEQQLASVRRDSPRLQARLASLEGRRTQAEERLRAVQVDLSARIQDNERLRIQQESFTEQARVSGRVAYYLENVKAVANDSRLPQAIERLRAEVSELEQALDDETLQGRLDTALSLVNRDLTAYAGELGLEHGDNPLRLDLKNLTVVADTVAGPLPLSQMGSGENWVGYHVAAHLSLHKLFRLRKRPVPAFLMLDQPSQAHYPPERDENGRIDALADEDQAAVHGLFELLFKYSSDPSSSMQIIVSDHVELLAPWFHDSIVQRWRDGIKFVPQTWLRS
ncbi:DUF3732 domain-containing protein [Frankia sp. RB7]|nr:DUF3732 domain-containing protein [Frankia sp. RB7]